MATRVVEIELPDELIDLLGSVEQAAARARTTLVLDLLREGRLSQGQSAGLLNVSRWELLEIMARHEIASGPETAEEQRHEIEAARRIIARS